MGSTVLRTQSTDSPSNLFFELCFLDNQRLPRARFLFVTRFLAMVSSPMKECSVPPDGVNLGFQTPPSWVLPG